jgi:hypothetical protein
MKTQAQSQNEMLQRVIVFLNREQVDFLDKIGKDTLFSGKKKLSRTKIISGLVSLIMNLGVSGKNLDSAQAIADQIKFKIKNGHG